MVFKFMADTLGSFTNSKALDHLFPMPEFYNHCEWCDW